MTTRSSSAADELSRATSPKRTRSTRISQLASRFEPSSSPAPTPDLAPEVSPSALPTVPAPLTRSWSKLGGGRVERNVRRFSAENLPRQEGDRVVPPVVERTLERESSGIATGSLGEMDWTPRTTPPVSTPALTSSSTSNLSPPPPAARFRHRNLLQENAKTRTLASPTATRSRKAAVATTVAVSATVTSTPMDGKTKLEITGHARANPPEGIQGGRGPVTDDRELVSNSLPAASSPPLLPSRSFGTVSSATPSFATSEATAVEPGRTFEPPIPECTAPLTLFDCTKISDGADLDKFPPSPRSNLPPRFSATDLPDITMLESRSTPAPASVSLPSIAPLPPDAVPLRPQLSRGATSLLTTSTNTPHSYPAHEIFARGAAPLHLPDLDRLLETLEPPKFSRVSLGECDREGGHGIARLVEGIELDRRNERAAEKRSGSGFGSEEERKSWNDWVQGPPPSLWSKLVGIRTGTAIETDKESLIDGGGLTKEQACRSLIFPPFHRLSPKATLTDLKSNVRKPPPLLSGNALLQMAADGALNLFGSAAGIRLTTVEGLRDLMQMCTLLVTSASPSLSLLAISSDSRGTAPNESPSTFRTVLITIPSAFSLDFASAFGHAFLFLLGFTSISFLALYEFYRFTGGWRGPSGTSGRGTDLDLGEGYDREDVHVRKPKRRVRDGRRWKVLVTFYLTTIYLPLSKLALSALFWERGYWPSELFGTATVDDQCFTTVPRGHRGGTFNCAIVILPVAFAVLVTLGGWFPMRMFRVVERSKLAVDRWTELGELRRDKRGEYERLLDKDPSPYSFLYREYRREWASFRSIYMSVKLVNVFIVVLISADNCVFLDRYSESKLDVIRQATLFVFMTAFFALDVYSRPQLDEISNRSDRISRLGYVGISLCGLLVALGVPGRRFWDGSAIVVINAFSYSFNFYFAMVGTQIARRFIKRVRRRLDFSIDVFSPQLDLSKHIGRRIWQETFSALFLTAPDFAMESSKKLEYAGPPPYLLNFRCSVAERHAENLKVLREIGLDAYYDACEPADGSTESEIHELRRQLQYELAGPDVYYRPRSYPPLPSLITTYFGRLDIVPFPFTAVFRYDQSPTTEISFSSRSELEDLVRQQSLPPVRSARKIRTALRALEGQPVYCPRIHHETVKGKRGEIEYTRPITYTFATIEIRRNSELAWRGYNYSSGFDLTVEWRDGVGVDANDHAKVKSDFKLVLSGTESGIVSTDFTLTSPLSLLLRDNRNLVEQRFHLVEAAIDRRRRFFADEADNKRKTLSYEFLMSIFSETDLSISELDARLRQSETNERIRNLVGDYPTTFTALQERMKAVTASRVASWWYVVWDDLYRRNTRVFVDMAPDFSPHYTSSICYRPMPRAQLESFLNERGFPCKARAYFSPGFLNQIYFVLDELAFSSTGQAVPIHLASPFASSSTLKLEEPIHYSALARALSHRTPESSAWEEGGPGGWPGVEGPGSRLTAGTGDGTNEDDAYIRSRRAFLFEQLWVEEPRPAFVAGRRREWLEHLVRVRLRRGVSRWLGWTLNETNTGERRKRGRESGTDADEVLLDLKRGREGWTIPRGGH